MHRAGPVREAADHAVAVQHLVAQGGHDGFARAIFPVHTRADGDAVVVAATGALDAPIDRVRALAVLVVEQAIRSIG